MSQITHVCRKTNWIPLTVSMGNPKIHIPQNCKVKLVYLREQLKARVKLLNVKESSWFYLLASTLFSQFLLQNMSRSNTVNRSRQNTDHAVYRPCRLSLFFLALVCALRATFWERRESEDTHEKSIFLLFRQNIPLGELIQGKIV